MAPRTLHREKPFWCISFRSVGWVVSEENFMKKQSVISFLKLRASYGIVGNDKIGGDRFSLYRRCFGT